MLQHLGRLPEVVQTECCNTSVTFQKLGWIVVTASQHLGHLPEVGPRLCDRLGLVRAGDGDDAAGVARHAADGVGKRLEICHASRQDLVAALLTLVVRHAQQVARQRRVALRVRQLVRIDVAHRSDDGL
eukprot:359945-Chlamydomonas_euryale.AAC.1